MTLPKNLDPNESRNRTRRLSGTVGAELNQLSFTGYFTYFETLRFLLQIEKKQTEFTVTKLSAVQTGVFTYQPN